MSLRRISDLSKANIYNPVTKAVKYPEKVAKMLFEVSYPNDSEGTWISQACTYDDLSNALLGHIFDWMFNGDDIELSGNFYYNRYKNVTSIRNTYYSKQYFNKFFAGSTYAGIFLDNTNSGRANLIANNRVSLRIGQTNAASDNVFDNSQGTEIAYADKDKFAATKLSAANLSAVNLTAASTAYIGNNSTTYNNIKVGTYVSNAEIHSSRIYLSASSSTYTPYIQVGSGTQIYDGRVKAATFEGTAMSALWADLAEYYVADKEYEPGTLVKFGGKYELTEADTEANAVVTSKPGFVLNNNIASADGIPTAIALVGRTPIKVVGKVKKFQNLALSDIPGIACAANGRKTIAKALADKDTDDVGLLECVVKLEF